MYGGVGGEVFGYPEFVDVKSYMPGAFILVLCWSCNLPSCIGDSSVDLSKATNLRNVVFQPVFSAVTWIITTLRTITSRHRDLQHISIQVPYEFTSINSGTDVLQTIGEAISGQWLDLDRLLVQSWESRSVRPRLIIATKLWERELDARYCIGSLFPEVTQRDIVELVEPVSSWHW